MRRNRFILCLLACSLCTAVWAQQPARAGADGGTAAVAATPADDDVDDSVETVKLGGEDRVNPMGQGVQQDDTETVPEDPNSPTMVGVGDNSATGEPLTPLKATATVNDPSIHDPSRVAYADTRRNARTMSLTVPGPRGLITDRNGAVMACSEVAYAPSINFGQMQDESDEAIVAVGRRVLAAYEAAGMKLYEKSDAQLIDHYRNRRWLPMVVGPVVRERDLEKKRKKLESIENAHLLPNYIRLYPGKTLASHILGYTGSQAKLPTGPINHNDPIFERAEGRSGLEKKFNKQLTGQPGIWRLMFDESGNKILDELQTKPKPGGTIVTTLNMEWQKAAEHALEKNTIGRGAFVMVDVRTGEVVVMASVPNYNPNLFIPSISQKDYDALRQDPNTPLVSRAFAGVYPPASTFKTITVAAALRYHIITRDSYIFCPYSVRIGGHEFKNHSHFTGSINCITALVLSNNPFMYQTAATLEPHLGAQRLCEIARRFGYGQSTGIPLPDKAGNVPDDAWMQRNYGRGFMAGDAANLSIGQGALLATPLQVAHAISGIANGSYMPKLQLIRQVLDSDGNVVYQFTPAVQSNLKDMSDSLSVVRAGMKAVVAGGTGRRAALSYVSNAGKTGTAQWGKPSDDCRLAWFAGFMPADEPRYAYVALYEGKPHQHISGGHMAAAIVKVFFESIRGSMKNALAEKPQARIRTGEGEEEVAEEVTVETTPVEAVKPRETEKVIKQREKEKRHSQSGWDDGRSRH